MNTPIDNRALEQIFTTARTANHFKNRPIPLELVRQIYDLAKMAPTSMNSQPTRYVVLASEASRARLLPFLMGSNIEKTRLAPVTVIVATDTQFYLNMPKIWHGEGAQQMFEASPAMSASTATRNGTLGGAYFMLAARAMGLACGPMSGFDVAKVNAEFFPDGRWQANFLLNLGYADSSEELARNPRLTFEDVCLIL
jgi:3-hydroxypropanoate dehydrogenase